MGASELHKLRDQLKQAASLKMEINRLNSELRSAHQQIEEKSTAPPREPTQQTDPQRLVYAEQKVGGDGLFETHAACATSSEFLRWCIRIDGLVDGWWVHGGM